MKFFDESQGKSNFSKNSRGKACLLLKLFARWGLRTTGNVAYVERDWERRKTEKRLGREGTFSSAFRAFLPVPSPPLPFFYASQATKILKTTCWEGLGLLTERKPLPSFHLLALIQYLHFYLSLWNLSNCFFKPVKQRGKEWASFLTVSFKWLSRQHCVTICSTVIA